MAKGSKAAALMRPSQMLLAFPEGYIMSDEESSQQIRRVRDRSVSKRMLAHQSQVSLAKLLLRLCDALGSGDHDQEFLDLYNEVKPIAERKLR